MIASLRVFLGAVLYNAGWVCSRRVHEGRDDDFVHLCLISDAGLPANSAFRSAHSLVILAPPMICSFNYNHELLKLLVRGVFPYWQELD